MSRFKNQLVRLGSRNPDLQIHLRPILDQLTKVAVSLGELAHEIGFDFDLDEEVDPREVKRALEAHPKITFEGKRSEVEFHRGRYYVNAEIMLEAADLSEQSRKINLMVGRAIDDGLPGLLMSDLNVEESWIIPEKAPPLTVIFTFSVMAKSGYDMDAIVGGVEDLRGTLGGSRLDLHHFDAAFWKSDYEQPLFEADAMVKAHPHIFEHGRLSKDKLRDLIEDTLFDNVSGLVSGARGAAILEIQSIRKD